MLPSKPPMPSSPPPPVTPLSGARPGELTLLFDGVCNLCSGAVQFVMARDRAGAVRFASLQSPAGQDLLRALDLPADSLSTMVLLDSGRAFVRSDAALRLARTFPWPWSWLGLFRLVPRALRDWVYDRIAANRYRWFGQRESCLLPTPENRARFLEGGTS